jgi:hypothetical protein
MIGKTRIVVNSSEVYKDYPKTSPKFLFPPADKTSGSKQSFTLATFLLSSFFLVSFGLHFLGFHSISNFFLEQF